VISNAGYKKVDLWGGPPNYASDPAECDVSGIKATAARYGVTVANLGTYAGRTFHKVGHDAEIQIMRHDIDNAVTLGARSIRVSPGHGEDPSIIDELVPFFKESAAYAAEKGVYLGMENHKGSIACNPEAVMRLVDAVGSPYFGILYEPANLMACEVDYKKAYELFRDHVVHVHVKDSHWVNGEYERTMLGDGDVDVPWVVRTLDGDGYAGDYALEFEIEKKVPIEEGLPAWLRYFQSIE
jgi:sugar phosphate isomerase/epimerase